MLEGHRVLDPTVQDKLDRARAICLGLGRTLVAFSGGVDSALLLKVACDAQGGDRVLGVIADSPSLARAELEDARRLAAEIGAALRVVPTDELARAEYRRNALDRCYHCKTELFLKLAALAAAEGFDTLAYGAIADDAGDVRPGMRSARERGVRAPLLEAGLGKAEVRQIARELGLRAWDKPARPCLSSRIPHGSEVTPEKLHQVEEAEAALVALGFVELRVRHHGEMARVELPVEELPRALAPALREEIVRRLRGAGFLHVTIDLAGYRRGGSDEPAPLVPAARAAAAAAASAAAAAARGRAGRTLPLVLSHAAPERT